MSDHFEAVLDFHKRFNALIGEKPSAPLDDHVALRISLIQEEFDELKEAMVQADLVEVADAVADLLYVIYGTAISYGIDIRPVFDEVHRTNMAKVGGGTRADGKVLKPEGWQPPNIAAILEGMTLQ